MVLPWCSPTQGNLRRWRQLVAYRGVPFLALEHLGTDRRFDLVPARANGQAAFGAHLRAPAGISHGPASFRARYSSWLGAATSRYRMFYF